MLSCDIRAGRAMARCSSLSSLRGRVAKCVKASPPEFCEVLECLDELMLAIVATHVVSSGMCEFRSLRSPFVV
jgi:hypothetical protein